MADEIKELYGKVSLMKGEKLKIVEGEISEAREQGNRCLVGRL